MSRSTRDGMRRVHPSSDTERVLGQIERGETRCGADAAREIAARHQAAYGDAVWGQASADSTRTTNSSLNGDDAR